MFAITAAGCSSTWEDAQESDTYESYQAYIDDNPEGEHVEEAKRRAEVRYWDNIKEDSTTADFENYINRYPDGQFISEARSRIDDIAARNMATKARVTGSNVIIRSDHTTESPSAGVVAKKGTVVQVIDQFVTANSSEAILSRDITVLENGNRISVSGGKAIRILADRSDSVRASFSTRNYGFVDATISKDDIEAMSEQRWYKIRTTDGITGWIYGKFIEEL